MLAAHSLSSHSLSSIDPYSDELPPITALPLLSRQPHFYHADTSPHSPSSDHIRSSPSSMSCAASYLSSSLACPPPALQQSAAVGLAVLRSSRSVDSLHQEVTYKPSSSSSSSSSTLSAHLRLLVRDRQQHEERKEAEHEQLHEYEHKEQQQRIRDVSHTSRQWKREGSKD